MTTPYVGRFAPSPTGNLHLGSLIGALASFLDARANGGKWLLRIEDIDPPREVAGAAEAIIESLKQHGLHWDGEILWQSQRHAAYQRALDKLLAEDKAFYCSCSRSELAAFDGIHSGRCRSQPRAEACAVRLEVTGSVSIQDGIQGPFAQNLASDCGDVILKRKDGLFAYQLAVVEDDAYQGITHVVRGADLFVSTPRQVFLQQALGYSTPQYAHFPVIADADGKKLSKQNLAAPIDSRDCSDNLRRALRFLQQPEPPAKANQVEGILQWAIDNWQPKSIPRSQSINSPDLADK